MYNVFYKLGKSPFSLNPNPDFLYLSPKHKKALAVLERSLVNLVGLSAITGEKGTGKSTLIRYLLKQSWPDVTFGLISESDTPPGSLLKRTLSAFGLNSSGKTTSESYDLLSDFMVIDCFWKKRQPVLIIDASLGMESRALEELYMLSTMEPEENRNLRIILAMPPTLWETLKRPAWTHLARHVGNSYQLENLNYQETVAYVQHRLKVAGAQSETLFDDPAYKAIFRYSGGNPRLINVLCNAALVQGSIQETPQIGAALIKDLIMQKLWLRAAITTPRGEARGRSETEGKNADQVAGIQSGSENLGPALGRLAKRDKTGQTVSEFIIADIDHASRKYARLDAGAFKASDTNEFRDEAPQRANRRFLRVASMAVIILITAAVAIFFDRDRSSRESQLVQGDQDARGQGLISALRPAQEVQQHHDLSDPIQAVTESASVVRRPIAQQERPDEPDFFAGKGGVPEDAANDADSSTPIAPASDQSEPVGGEGEASVSQESKDNVTPLVAEDESGATPSLSEAPLILIEAASERSEPFSAQGEVAVFQKSRDNATQLVTENEARATASDSEASSVPVEPTPEESESVGGQDEGSVPQESPENTAQLVAEDNTHETVPGSEAPLAPVKPVREGSTPGRGQEEGLLPKDGKDPAAGITVKDEMRANATDFKDFSAPVSSVSDRSRLVGTDSIEPTIAELLARAERQIAAKHLVTPAGDSALETYESILALVPGHSGASRGIDRIKEIYLTWAGAARQRGQLAKAQSYAQRAATVDPQDRGVARLLDQIKAERKLKAEMAALKKEDVEKAKAAVTPVEEAKALRKPDVETLKKPTPRPPAAAHAPDSLSSDLLAQRVSEIDSLLITAQQQFDAQHLTQPAGDNAWETYQKVLQLDPTNQRAREGLQRIVQRIEFTARGKQQNGDLLKSLAIIEEGLRVMPNHSGLSALKEEVNREIEAQRAATQAEEQPAPTTDKEEPPEPKKKKRRRVKTFGTFF